MTFRHIVKTPFSIGHYFSVVFMKPNQNTRQNRPARSNQNNNQKRAGRSHQNNNRNVQSNSPNRQLDSYGPAGNQRGNAKQLYEKYKALALDKRAADRIESEALDQYADHYYRLYAESAAVEAAAQLVREKERVRKEQEEIERRANAKTEGQTPPYESSDEISSEMKNEGQMADRARPKRPRRQKKPDAPDIIETSHTPETSQVTDKTEVVAKEPARKPRRKKIIEMPELPNLPNLEPEA